MEPSASPEPCRSATPYLIVHDAAQAIAFYECALGATEVVRLTAPDGKVMHAELRLGAAPLMVADEFPDLGYLSPRSLGGSAVSILLYVADVDAAFATALEAGAKEASPVADQFDGDRRGTLRDPFGHTWLLATRKEAVGPEALQARFRTMLEQGSRE